MYERHQLLRSYGLAGTAVIALPVDGGAMLPNVRGDDGAAREGKAPR